jgi:hypothetical protein
MDSSFPEEASGFYLLNLSGYPQGFELDGPFIATGSGIPEI